MRLLRYDASRFDKPQYSVALNRCHHGRFIGIIMCWNTRRYNWIWGMCK